MHFHRQKQSNRQRPCDPDFINYTGDVTVLVAETSPLLGFDTTALTPGTLWWSPISGKLYIYYTDSSHWVNINPAGTLSGPTVDSVVVTDVQGS